ncbi:neprilysin-like [Mizuhopecten yessoensis]|uniref:Neprilysin n=1 Tax=Mizuhopecten yessoensis TaxID=6573 RepID=A0A210PIH1_MIZYE|nr:neprilysin-like [Mizuhopecten yessoensis]OWF36277.1 Neprilysin [Mizuhopecten yessoensis]
MPVLAIPVMEMNGKSKHYLSEDGLQVKYTGPADMVQRRQRGWIGERTYLEVALLVSCGVLLCITVILIINEAVRHDDQLNGGASKLAATSTVCLSQDCVRAAARLLQGMNQEVDPCDNFFEFACGSWNKVNVIPDDRPSYNTFAKLRDDLHVTLKDLLESPVTSGECEASRKAKHLYHSCINETLIEERGIEPAIHLIEELGGWPVTFVNGTWPEETFDLTGLLIKLRLYNNKILVDQWVSADDKNSDVHIIQFDQPDLGMPSRDYYTKGRHDPDVVVYEEFAVAVAMVFGANKTVAEDDIREMVDLEIRLANITVPQVDRRDNEKLYNRMTVRELQQIVPGFAWMRYLRAIFDEVNITITELEEVVVYAPEYLRQMVEIINETPGRTLANYLIWRIMMNRMMNLPAKYRDLRKEYHRQIYGSEVERSRWRDCVSYVNDNMGNAVGRLFVQQHFDELAKNVALDMIHDIRIAFNELLHDVVWMDEYTRKVAEEKADAIVEKIGYPSYILNDTALDDDYRNVYFHSDKYFENVLENIKSIALANMARLREPVDKTRWSTTPAIVNAFYSSTKNQIMFPAGILQPPFYYKGYPKSLNYGGIGMVIGHEITHGFDDRGRQFDKDGNLKQWWDDAVIERFKNQTSCIVDQYGNYTMPGIGIALNGIQTQGENIADNGGLKEAYRAYSKWETSQEKREDLLPGLTHLNHHQLFFLNFAQVWCGTMRPEAAVNRIRTGLHSPGRFRVIGTLQNSKEFSQVFNCPAGSYMNPVKKCEVW